MGTHAYRWMRAAGWVALVWFTAAVLTAGYTASDVLSRPLREIVGDASALGAAVDVAPIPGLLLVGGLVAVACPVVLSRGGATVLLGLALAATVPPAFAGHSASGSGDHRVAVSAMLPHIVGVVLWAGGLLALALAHRLPTADLERAVRRFSGPAGWCLAVGLSRTPTPAGEPAAGTQGTHGAHGAAEVSGVAMPEEPGVRSLTLDWRPEPVFLTMTGIAIVLYLAGCARAGLPGR